MIYRPISLCNFSYKFILKVMANRLRLVSPKLVSPLKVHLFQIIHDNIFFSDVWIRWMVQYITTPSFEVIVNGRYDILLNQNEVLDKGIHLLDIAS